MKVVVLLAAVLCAVVVLPVPLALCACSSSTVPCKERCQPNCASPPFEQFSSKPPTFEEENVPATKQPFKTEEREDDYSLIRKWWNELPQEVLESDRSKRAVGRYVYRALRWDENPNLGLFAKNPLARESIPSHVGQGSTWGYTSQYISTTKSLRVATYQYARRGNRIAQIDVAIALASGRCQVFDVSNGGYGLEGQALTWARRSQEVLFTGTIPPQAITLLPRRQRGRRSG